jgi:hypothetical protein
MTPVPPGAPASFWLRSRSRLALPVGALAAAAGLLGSPAPGHSLDELAHALGLASGECRVRTADIRWEPSSGALSDLLLGRGLLFLASAPGEETRDVWRARVRVSPEGSVLGVVDAHDLTNTPLGDDHELVVLGPYAAFATRAYGQEQSVTVLSLDGEGPQNKAEKIDDRIMAAITNAQQTGKPGGIGRVDVSFDIPAQAASLAMDASSLAITIFDAYGSHVARLDLARGELFSMSRPGSGKAGDLPSMSRPGSGEVGAQSPSPGMRADASMHLPKRFSHWAVDTLRAVPWIGPAPIAWAEDQALALVDAYRRFTFKANAGSTDVVSTAEPSPPVLDTSQASVDEGHWPPPRIPTIWKQPEAGEGEWQVPDVPWLRKVPGVTADAYAPLYRTFIRPDEERPYVKVILVAMDTRQLDLDMEAGVEDPEPLTGPHGTGRLPRDPAIYRRVAAAFNGAFKTEHGHYGMMVHRRVLLPPVPGAATVVVLEDGRVGMGTWGADRKVGGLVGVDDDGIESFRQNLDALLDRGQVNPTGRSLWGFTLPGKGAQTERSGLCVTTSGHLMYAWGDDVSATALAKAMKMGGCDYAMHLDMNPYHTGFIFAAIEDFSGKRYKTQLLSNAMSIQPDRYVQYSPKDFFYVMVRDPAPPVFPGAPAWAADGGAQPPPHWMPGIWSTRVDAPQGSVELLDLEPGRATWRIRAGAGEAAGAAPARELGEEDAKRALLVVGAGVDGAKHPRGIATDGRLAVPVRGGADSGVVVVGGDGRLSIARAVEAMSIEEHEDALELPLLVWDGKAESMSAGTVEPRAALGETETGRVVIARGTFGSDGPLADALVRAGCTRAVALNRGMHASALLDRTGTPKAPKARYDESVLYAIATPMRPRGFHFDPATLVAQGNKAR